MHPVCTFMHQSLSQIHAYHEIMTFSNLLHLLCKGAYLGGHSSRMRLESVKLLTHWTFCTDSPVISPDIFTIKFMWAELKDINSDYWKALVLSLITAGGVIKLEEVWQAHSSRLFQVRSLRGVIPGTYIVNHQIHLIGIIPLRGLFITSCRDLIIPSLWQPFDLSSIATRQGP